MGEVMTKDNQRTRLTKRLLRESLLELLHKKTVEHITVKELCEWAELNRSTFYAYYCDVDALYQEMGNELVDALLQYVDTMCADKAAQTGPMLTFIQERSEIFRLLIYNGQYMDMSRPLQRRIFDGTLSKLSFDHLHCSTEKQYYMMQYLFMGGGGMIHSWVQRGCDLPCQEVAGLIEALNTIVLANLPAIQ